MKKILINRINKQTNLWYLNLIRNELSKTRVFRNFQLTEQFGPFANFVRSIELQFR